MLDSGAGTDPNTNKRQGSVIAERPARRSVSVEMLSTDVRITQTDRANM